MRAGACPLCSLRQPEFTTDTEKIKNRLTTKTRSHQEKQNTNYGFLCGSGFLGVFVPWCSYIVLEVLHVSLVIAALPGRHDALAQLARRLVAGVLHFAAKDVHPGSGEHGIEIGKHRPVVHLAVH